MKHERPMTGDHENGATATLSVHFTAAPPLNAHSKRALSEQHSKIKDRASLQESNRHRYGKTCSPKPVPHEPKPHRNQYHAPHHSCHQKESTPAHALIPGKIGGGLRANGERNHREVYAAIDYRCETTYSATYRSGRQTRVDMGCISGLCADARFPGCIGAVNGTKMM